MPLDFVQRQLGLDDPDQFATFRREHGVVVMADDASAMDPVATTKEVAALEAQQAEETARKKSGRGVDIHHMD